MDKADDRKRRFVDELLACGSQRQAYKTVYKGAKSDAGADASSSRLLRDATVKAYLAERLEAMHTEKIADATEVMEYLTAVMRGEPAEKTFTIVSDADAIQLEGKETPDTKDRLKAAELLGKRLGLFASDGGSMDVTQVVIVGGDQVAD